MQTILKQLQMYREEEILYYIANTQQQLKEQILYFVKLHF